MKKLISIFLILCMMATLLPTVAFAEDGDTENVVPIVVDFTKTTLPTGSAANTSYEGIVTPGYEINTDKSTTKGVRVNFVGNGLNTIHDQGYGSLSAKKTWPGEKDSEYVKNLMLTINVEVATAGYYSPELIYGTNCYCGDFAIYINDQYAGEITDAYNADSTAKAEADPMTLNTIYLKEGKNEISFKCTLHRGTRTQSYLLLNKLTFTPCEETFVPVTFTTSAFPERVVAGEAVNFEISADIDESQTKISGTYSTYNEDGSNMETNLTVASENGTFEINEQSASVVKGTFTATKGGAATITATANVNGKTYTQTIETTAVAPIVATFSKNNAVSGATKYNYDALAGRNYTVVETKSREKANFMMNNGDYFQTEMYYIGSTGLAWPQPGKSGEHGLLFTISINVDVPGNYSPEFLYKATNIGGDFTAYINDYAAGEIKGYEAGNATGVNKETTFNTVYLNEGPNEISFRLTGTYRRENTNKYEGTWFYPQILTFTPVDAVPTPVGFTTTLTEAKAGEPVEFTVKPVMSDDSDMYFGIYDDAGTKITDKPISLTTNGGTITNLTRTTEGVSGTFTATEAGTAKITASTTINGAPCTDTFDVIVTSDEDEEVTLPATITMSVTGTAGQVTVDETVQNSATATYNRNVGDSVTVEAKDIDGKIFRGWLRGGENGTVVWLDNKYTFTAATNVALYAKYTDAPVENTEAKEYYDWNGEFLAYDSYDSANLSKYGFKFDKWLSNVVENITRYVADYVAADKKYTITKPDGSKLENVAHESSVTLTNQTAVSWYVNGSLVAYGENYTFYATEDAIVTIDNKVQEGPIVNLTNPDGDTYILEYNANGKTVIEKGIIFGEGTPSVTSCSYKVISQRNDAFGKLMAENDGNCAKVRGYIIYKDGNTHRVVYADIAAQ